MDWYQIAMFFIIYSFLGWVVEVAYHGVKQGIIVNRGFLNGPVCPVYGFGVVGILLLTEHMKIWFSSDVGIPVLFVIGVVVASLIELLAGWLLDLLFHARWWDYSNQKWNLNGYICPRFSVIWGAAIVFVVKIMQPYMNSSDPLGIPRTFGIWILGVVYILYFADLVVTVAIVQNMNRRLKELDQIRSSMRIVSDGLSEIVGTTSIKASQKIGEGQVQAALAKAELRDAAQLKKEEFVDAAQKKREELQEMTGAAVQKTAEMTGAAVQKTAEMTGAAVQKTAEMTGAAVQKTAELTGTAVQKTVELTGAAVHKTAELTGATAQKTAEFTEAARQKTGETRDVLLRRKEELQRRADELTELMMRKGLGARRMMEAFPRMRPRDYKETWNELRERMSRLEKKEKK